MLLVRCSLLEKGYTNSNKQYVPKKAYFELKDKEGTEIGSIDTLAVYKMVAMYNDGKLIYPLKSSHGFNKELNSIYNYIKFYKNGRCLDFSIPVKDALGMPNSLKESDMNPNNNYYSKDYYYSSNGKDIQIESFVYGAGQGHYVISNYLINGSGSSLTLENKHTKIVYEKQVISVAWNEKYKVDW